MTVGKVNVVVTGVGWVGSGIGSIESALERLFREARQEVTITAYSISSGADIVLQWIEEALARGIQVRFIINRLDFQPTDVVAFLRRLAAHYAHFQLYNFTSASDVDLHAKTIVVDRKLALVGSSNLSRRGLLANYELAVLVDGIAAGEIAQTLDLLLNTSDIIRLSGNPK
jgi:phosphatidylserine/phosphatidylglycerophosphate/cardiolipin synthase-like enzyme